MDELLKNAHTLRALRSLVDLDEHDRVLRMSRVVDHQILQLSCGQDGRITRIMEWNGEVRHEEMKKIMLIMRMNNVDAIYFIGSLMIGTGYSNVVFVHTEEI